MFQKNYFKYALLCFSFCLLLTGCKAQSTVTETSSNSKETETDSLLKGNITVIENFNSPQLKTDFTLRIYLPYGYEESTSDYPVIYMQDGQNLFSSETATYGKEWQIDETLDLLYTQGKTDGIIVVGVDSHDNTRNKDYNLFLSPQNGSTKGNANLYADFLTNTLKPYIDENYRTLSDREHTAIIGSSYGAISSICTDILHPDVFGFVGLFSYCDNLNPDQMTNYLEENMTPDVLGDTYLYFYAGSSDFAFSSTNAAYQLALDNGIEHVLSETDDGSHDELSWGPHVEECLNFFEWLK